jgi:hypothetical protein
MATVMMEPVRERASTRFRPYLPIGIFALIVAFVGFWANYYGRIFTGTVTTPPIIQVHAAIFIGWLLIVITQATLAARRRMALHMRLGNYLMAYGIAVVAIGLIGSFVAAGYHLDAGNLERARAVPLIGLTDMLAFAPFLAAAWVYRRKPEVHKRLIVVATTVLLIAPVHRMHWFLGGPPAPVAAVLAIWLAPIYFGMIYDWVTRRIVHPVYLSGILAIGVLKFARPALIESDAWQSTADWLLTLYS